MIAASCLCKKIKLHFQQFDSSISHCHCSMCRKFSGAGFGTFGTVYAHNLVWDSGQEFLKIYHSSKTAERAFCSECGSSIYYRFRQPNAPYEIALGILDNEPEQKVTANIFWANRVEWLQGFESLVSFDQSKS